MKLRQVKVGRLVSGPGYSNKSAEVVIELEDGDTLEEARIAADRALGRILGTQTWMGAARQSILADLEHAGEDQATPEFDDDDIPF